MPSMSADNDHIHLTFFGRLVDFDLRRSENQMPTPLLDPELASKVGQMCCGLVVDLILNRREVHGNLSAITETEGLDDMNDMQLGSECIGDGTCATRDMSCVFGEVGSQKDSFDLRHSPVTHKVA